MLVSSEVHSQLQKHSLGLDFIILNPAEPRAALSGCLDLPHKNCMAHFVASLNLSCHGGKKETLHPLAQAEGKRQQFPPCPSMVGMRGLRFLAEDKRDRQCCLLFYITK